MTDRLRPSWQMFNMDYLLRTVIAPVIPYCNALRSDLTSDGYQLHQQAMDWST